MQLNDLLKAEGVDPARTLVLRHRPAEPLLRKAMPMIIGERRPLFDVYQAYQSPMVEQSIVSRIGGWLASFLSYGPGKAVLIGLYKITGQIPETEEAYWARAENHELRRLGQSWPVRTDEPFKRTYLVLEPLPHLQQWSGKLVVGWPPPERSWYRRAERNVMPVHAIREESTFHVSMPSWDEIETSVAELRVLPSSWQAALAQWRGIYSIFDASDGKRYVGSAYGAENLLGRWMDYATTGHGGNKLLKGRDPTNFRFTILQRVSPDMDADEVIRLEASWKLRLQTRSPNGLNEN